MQIKGGISRVGAADGYTTGDVVYRWDHGVPVSIKGDVSLAQYLIRNITQFESRDTTTRGGEPLANLTL